MFKTGAESWDLRAGHMFRTLNRILEHRGPGAKAIIWAHNSHVGDAKATTISPGDVNLGRLAREKLGADAVALLGTGTYTGTVAAAREWNADVEFLQLPPPPPPPGSAGSVETLAHATGRPSFFLDLRDGRVDGGLRRELMNNRRKERFIGVVFDPETADPETYYADALLSEQFDGFLWFDVTKAVKPFEIHQPKSVLHLTDTYPWGL
jgi:erythromycin esterase-like protein